MEVSRPARRARARYEPDELRGRVLEAADAIRQARGASDVRRSHRQSSRCAACGYRAACGSEALS